MNKRQVEDKEPTLAAGLYDHEGLSKPATEKEIDRGIIQMLLLYLMMK